MTTWGYQSTRISSASGGWGLTACLQIGDFVNSLTECWNSDQKQCSSIWVLMTSIQTVLRQKLFVTSAPLLIHYAKMESRTVYYQELGERGTFRGSISAQHFERQRRAVNKKLKKKFKQTFTKFRIPFPQYFDTDLVHYSNQGMRAYYHGVRRVLSRHRSRVWGPICSYDRDPLQNLH